MNSSKVKTTSQQQIANSKLRLNSYNFYRNFETSQLIGKLDENLSGRVQNVGQAAVQGPSAFEQLFLRKIKVFEPDDTFILVWEFINSLFIILIMSLIIIDTFIEKPSWLLEDNETMLVLSISVPVLTIHYLDIFFIQFNVSYYEKFQIIKDRRSIANRYFKLQFWIDFLSVSAVLVYLVIDVKSSNYLLFIYFLKFKNLTQFSEKVLTLFQLHRNWKAAYKILRLFLYLLFFYAVFAIMFYQAGIYALSQNQNSWLSTNNYKIDVMKYSKIVRFEYSFYWSVQCGINAFGEFTGQNPAEVFVSIIALTFGGVIYSIFVVLLWEIVLEQTEGKIRYQKLNYAINRFMRNKNIDKDFSRKINEYLFYSWRHDRYRDYEMEVESKQKLSQEMQQELVYRAYKNFIKELRWMEGFSQQFKRNLATKVREQYYSQQEEIFEQQPADSYSDQRDSSIFFIEKGQVELYYNMPGYQQGNGLSCEILNSQRVFGEWQFFTQQSNLISARALNYSVIYRISRKDFQECLEHSPQDREMFQQMLDDILFRNNSEKIIENNCYVCQSNEHSYNACTVAHIAITEQSDIGPFALKQKNQRMEYIRNQRKRTNAVKSQQANEKSLQGIHIHEPYQQQKQIKSNDSINSNEDLDEDSLKSVQMLSINDEVLEDQNQLQNEIMQTQGEVKEQSFQQIKPRQEVGSETARNKQEKMNELEFDKMKNFKLFRPEANYLKMIKKCNNLRKVYMKSQKRIKKPNPQEKDSFLISCPDQLSKDSMKF